MQERVEYMRSLGTCFDVAPDPQVIITLMCQVFHTSSALLALVDSDRIYVRCTLTSGRKSNHDTQ